MASLSEFVVPGQANGRVNGPFDVVVDVLGGSTFPFPSQMFSSLHTGRVVTRLTHRLLWYPHEPYR
jgi:hypothetical protein